MQVLFYMNKPNEELKAINDFLQIFPNDAVRWGNKSNTLHKLGMYIESEKAITKALSLSTDDPRLYFIMGQVKLHNGNYSEAQNNLNLAQKYKYPDQDNVDEYISVVKVLLRQLTGLKSENMEIPQNDWKPNYNEYNNIFEIGNKDIAIVFIVGSQSRIVFKGTQENPFKYAPNFFVWDGAVINDEDYGILLENNTKFKHIKIDGKYKIEKLGIIEGWKAKITNERKIKLTN